MSANENTVKESFNLYDNSNDENTLEETVNLADLHNRENADPLVMPNLVITKPGILRTTGSLVLHTRGAHQLFYGRKKDEKNKIKPITGLVRFTLNMNQLYDLASKNDPYADAVLLTIEDGLRDVLELIKSHIKEVESILDDIEGITIDSNGSTKPIQLPLEFRTTYGFIAAQVIAKYDKLIRVSLCCMHVSGTFLQDDWDRVVRKSGSKIRNVFWQSSRYRFTGVTRDDIAANNQVARKAIDKYGELPQGILEATTRGKFSPKIISKSQL